MNESFMLSVGIDCGSQIHQVCVLNTSQVVMGERRVEHTGADIQALADWLFTLGETDPSRIFVAIEVPRGPIVEALLERGFRVWAINPKQLERFRERGTAVGAKDDQRDAWALASAVQTDRYAFRALMVDDPQIIQLRGLSRLDAELGEELTRTTNRLRDHLHRYYPQLLQLCPAADEAWVWQLLARAPTPAQGQRLHRATLQRLLTDARIRRFTADDRLAILRTPSLTVAPGAVEAASHYVTVLLPRLHLLHSQRLECSKQLARLLETLTEEPGQDREHHDVTILLSLPGVGTRIAATMLAEASQPLRARDYHAVRSLAGLAPVTKASGTRRVVVMRYACNTRLRTACYHWARVATQTDVAARRHYTILRQAGHAHPRALRGVADRLLAVLVGMLKSNTLYDHQRRRTAAA